MRQGAGSDVETTSPLPVRTSRRIVSGLARRAKRVLPAEVRPRVVPFGVTRGLRISTDLRGPAYFPLGLYEYEIQHWFKRLAAPGGLAYDVGAASGVQTLALAGLTGREVVAFEADPDALAGMREHLLANPVVAKLVTVEAAFVGHPDTRGMVALDEYTMGREPPTVIKIDVEGAELDVLRGARRLLGTYRPHLLIETHSERLERAIAEMLITADYRPIVIRRRKRLREDRPAVHNQWLAAVGSPPTR